MRYLLIIAMCGLLIGCAQDITIKMQPHELQAVRGEPLAQVKVNDLRAPGIAASKRDAAFGVPMGNITFQPKEAQLVKSLLEVELTRLMMEKGIQTQKNFVCDIKEFGANTITTPIYWDVIGRIQLVLQQKGKEYNLFGTHTERTFVWPSEAVIKKSIDESLKQIIPQLRQVAIE